MECSKPDINDIKNEDVRNALWYITNDITSLDYPTLQKMFDDLLIACIKADQYDEMHKPKLVIKKKTTKYSKGSLCDLFGGYLFHCPTCNAYLGCSASDITQHCKYCGQRFKAQQWMNITKEE